MNADPNVIDYGKYLIYRSQVFRKPAMLAYVPEAYKTYELCLAAFVFDEVNSLQYVPDRHKTYELCLTAVKCSGTNYFFVPEEHRTEELKEAAMKQNRWLKLENITSGENSPLKEPIGYNNAEASGTEPLDTEPGCCDDDISDIEEESDPIDNDLEPFNAFASGTESLNEREVIHRMEYNERINRLSAALF